VAIGQTFVLAIGGIDLSQGAVVGLTSVVGAMLLATVAPGEVLSGSPIWGIFIDENGGLLATADYAIPMALAAMLLVAVLIGAFNGASVAWLRMPPFMVTLVTMIAIGAFAIYITHSENIRNLPESYIALGKGDLRVGVYRLDDEPRYPDARSIRSSPIRCSSQWRWPSPPISPEPHGLWPPGLRDRIEPEGSRPFRRPVGPRHQAGVSSFRRRRDDWRLLYSAR
jgi:hypothetical protein